MSPEQATADREPSAASDLYSLGCVLYEMLVGEPQYLGNTAQAVLGKIISGEPVSATKQRSTIPANVDAAIRKALEKLPADRFPSAEEFVSALTNPAFRHGEGAAAAEGSPARSASPLALVATAVLALLAGAAGWALLRPDPPAPVSRYAVGLPDGHSPAGFFGSNLAMSPDGMRMLYVGPSAEGAGQQLWLRRRDRLEPSPLSGTLGAASPTFSPDGQRVAFISEGSLKVVSLGGEPPITVAGEGLDAGGLSWGEDGYIYVDASGPGLGRVPEMGGKVERISTPDSAQGEGPQWWPQALPGGKGVLVTIPHSPISDMTQYDLAVVNLETGIHTVLLRGVLGRYVASGHLLYVTSDGTLLAAPFDVAALATTGPPTALVEGVGVQAFGTIDLAAADDGTLAYVTGAVSSGLERAVWVTRAGVVTPVDPDWEFAPGRPEVGVELSPDGTRLAVKINTDAGEDIWVKELDRGPLSRLTFDEAVDRRPRWSTDGRWIYFNSNRAGEYDLYRKPSDGTGSAELVLDLDRPIQEVQRTPDEEWTVLRLSGQSGVTGLRDLVALRSGETETVPVATEPYDEKGAALSPDGRWLAYESNETGEDEIYVRPFPNAADGKWQVSTGGGVNPRWAHTGREIFYVNGDGELSVAEVSTAGGFRVGRRQTLFSLDDRGLFYGANYAGWDVAGDDERFLMVQFSDVEALAAGELIVVENFLEELGGRLGN